RHIPIIFLTAEASDLDAVVRAYSTGAVDYVVKPFEPAILRAKVSVFVELSRERGERVRQSHARAQAEAVARTVRTLQILSDTAFSRLELGALASELVSRAATLFGADAAGILVRDELTPWLDLVAARGEPLPVGGDGRLMLGEGVLGRLAAEARPALLHPAAGELEDPPSSDGAPAPPGALGSLLAVPLVSAGEPLGLLLLGTFAPRRWDTGDLELLALAADRMAIAIDHVHRFADGRRLVETLQRSLLPDRLPRHARLQVAARYLPAGPAPQIGGDWYDALSLDGYRTAVMIGDVVGHGVRAATRMSELRNALRAFAIEGHEPAQALHQLDRVVHATLGVGMVATALFLVIDPARGEVTLARAGHPPPALRRADGSVVFLSTEGTLPLGVDASMPPEQATWQIAPGDTLLVFTDGLIERRGESITAGLQRLGEVLADAPADVERLCDQVLEGTAGDTTRPDDVALLAVRLLDASVEALELTLPVVPESIPTARRELRRWLTTSAPELDPAVRSDLELVFSEACTNVVRHAGLPHDATFMARATRDAGALVLGVDDGGRWSPPGPGHAGHGLDLMRMLCDELRIDRGPGGTRVEMRLKVAA
ncbi:MAG: SpoIIE family protein phosphatase, partial [Solirubrobacteraceae bacterium]